MIKTKNKTITEPRLVSYVVGRSCDKCKREIKDKEIYYEIYTHHHDWGNDSIDSYENFDLCNDCYLSFIGEYFKEAIGTEELNISREINMLE